MAYWDISGIYGNIRNYFFPLWRKDRGTFLCRFSVDSMAAVFLDDGFYEISKEA